MCVCVCVSVSVRASPLSRSQQVCVLAGWLHRYTSTQGHRSHAVRNPLAHCHGGSPACAAPPVNRDCRPRCTHPCPPPPLGPPPPNASCTRVTLLSLCSLPPHPRPPVSRPLCPCLMPPPPRPMAPLPAFVHRIRPRRLPYQDRGTRVRGPRRASSGRRSRRALCS